ncbi:hypothetical protein GGX14DRAFT_384462 [Mycena pura]|uniref:Uncharacterized protein n=1 Tax=Mycena pura TaxID=153505 RepID=A0AAD6YVF5_9AGAR|nr:hypothetical protein GGX14DRAFT_384462 [Mycena pura]
MSYKYSDIVSILRLAYEFRESRQYQTLGSLATWAFETGICCQPNEILRGHTAPFAHASAWNNCRADSRFSYEPTPVIQGNELDREWPHNCSCDQTPVYVWSLSSIKMHSHSHSYSEPSQTAPPPKKVPCIVSHIHRTDPQHQHRRRRTLSVSLSSPGSSGAKIIIAMQSSTSTSVAGTGSAAGSFTLTGCAREALRELTFLAFATDADEEETSTNDFGAYTHDFGAYTHAITRPRARTDSSCTDVSVPSISRTASPFSERPPIPPGWGARPRPRAREKDPERASSCIHPALETLERASRVGTGRAVCAGCMKPGVNLPRCRHCAKVWCSHKQFSLRLRRKRHCLRLAASWLVEKE